MKHLILLAVPFVVWPQARAPRTWRSGSAAAKSAVRPSDAELMRHLREHDVLLEIRLTSNLITGVVKSLEEHPLRRLYDAGVPIVLNTDAPAMFHCTLAGEYRLAARQFSFSEAEMRGIAENAFRYASGDFK